jgi:hypothetical protein
MAKKLYGTDPDQVPTNADLGTIAYQDSKNTVLENAYINAKGADGLEMGRDYTSPNNSSRLFFNSSVSGGNWTIFNNSGGLKIQSGAEAGSTSGNYTSVALSTTGMVLSGTVEKPNQPAFQVRKNSAQENLPNNDAPVTITWETEIFDQSSNFASSAFTAPVSGKYFLQASAYLASVDTAANYVLWGIRTSNRDYYAILDPNYSSDLTYFEMNVNVVADMDASDTAYVFYQQSGGSAQTDIVYSNGTFFSGCLVA